MEIEKVPSAACGNCGPEADVENRTQRKASGDEGDI